MRSMVKDMTGARYGMLVAVRHVGAIHTKSGNKMLNGWEFMCDCGNLVVRSQSHVRRGNSKSCGCYRRELSSRRQTTHGHTSKGGVSSEYMSWKSMHDRCRVPGNASYKSYGARGISVCDRWSSFEIFLSDMGKKEDPSMQIDRINNSKGYSPENCKWSTRSEQQNNRTCNVRITHKGMTLTAAQWSKKTGISQSTIGRRIIAGWTDEKTVTTPARHKSKKMAS